MSCVIFISSIFSGVSTTAQNVGIGTITPQATLDVRGNHRMGGISNYITYDSITGRIEWRNANLYVPVSQFLMKHSAAGDGLFYNNTTPVSGQLEYRNAGGEPVFYTNFTNGKGYFKGNLGIGTINPGAMLHVRNNSSGYNGPYHSPAVIESWDHTYLQFLAPDLFETGVLFGRASDPVSGGIVYNSFIHPSGMHLRTGGNLTRVVINEQGNVGIGLYLENPTGTLDVIRGTAPAGTAVFRGTVNISHFNYGTTEDTYIRGGKAGARVILNDRPGTGGVGIGTDNPLAKLHVSDSSVLFSAPGSVLPVTPSNPPVSGPGRRVMWYADKAAFRAGTVFGDRWNKDSIGNYSFASGYDTKASGEFSTALGGQTTASGYLSTAIGYKANASGQYSTAIGFLSEASGELSTAMGFGTSAKAPASLSIGMYNDATDSPNPNMLNPQDRIFQIGNGNPLTVRSNALTVLRNGNTGIGTTNPTSLLHIRQGSAGGTAPFGPLSVETNGAAYIGLLTPDGAFESGIIFGRNSNNVSGAIVYNNNLNQNGLLFRTNNNTDRVAISSIGNMGIGINNPAEKLHVIGHICATGTMGSCSDIRYKKDFSPISNSLHSVLSLNGFYYYWKKDEFRQFEFSEQKQVGFSAQEVEKLFPEVVMTDATGYKSVDYGRLTPVLVEAIKEQQLQINKQEQQLNTQQQQIDELKKLVEKLLNK